MTAEVLSFLSGSPIRIALFEAVEAAVFAAGDSGMTVSKTQISWGNPKKFAFFSLPVRRVPGRPVGNAVLSFGLDHQEVHPKIAVASNPYPNRWTHHVILTATDEIDDTVRAWLREAYAFAKTKGRRPSAK